MEGLDCIQKFCFAVVCCILSYSQEHIPSMHLQAVRQKTQALKGMIPQGFMLDFAYMFLYVSQYLSCIFYSFWTSRTVLCLLRGRRHKRSLPLSWWIFSFVRAFSFANDRLMNSTFVLKVMGAFHFCRCSWSTWGDAISRRGSEDNYVRFLIRITATVLDGPWAEVGLRE